MARNFKNLQGKDIAERLATDCFTDEQKTALEFTQGKVKVSIEDQINLYYSDSYLTFDEEMTVKAFATKLDQYAYLIDSIKEYKALITQIRTPGNFYETTVYNVDVHNDGTNKNTGAYSSTSKTYGAAFDTSSQQAESDSKNITRSLSTQTSRLHKGLEELDINAKLKLETSLKHIQKNIDYSVIDSSKGLPTKAFKEVVKESENPDQKEEKSAPVLPYNAVNFSHGHSSELSVSNQYGETLTAADIGVTGNSTITNELAHRTHGETNAKKYVASEATLKTLTSTIPALRIEFWNKFATLFKGEYYCPPSAW